MTRLGLAVLCIGCSPSAGAPAPRPLDLPVRSDPPQVVTAPTRQAPRELQVAIGQEHTCVRIKTSLHCWSRDADAKLPITENPRVAEVGDVVDVAAGNRHVCALNRLGQVWCWGDNEQGQLGAGLVERQHPAPVRLPTLSDVVELESGDAHTCALHRDGSVSCWGRNRGGQTGGDVWYGSGANDLVEPGKVPGIAGATEVVLGESGSCARAPNRFECWGRVGLGPSEGSETADVGVAPVPALASASRVALSSESGCALFGGGRIACWGYAFRPPDVETAGLAPWSVRVPRASAVAVGRRHACALLEDRHVSCWGEGTSGQLGRGSLERSYAFQPPEAVPGLERVVELALASQASCAVTSTNELWCWGALPHKTWANENQTGTPVRVPLALSR